MYLHFSDIHKADLLYEEGFGTSLQIVVLDEPVQDGKKWTFSAATSYGIMDYMMTDGMAHYGPRLSREPTRLVVRTISGHEVHFGDVMRAT